MISQKIVANFKNLQKEVPASIIGFDAIGNNSAKVYIGSSRVLNKSEITKLFSNTSLTPYTDSYVVHDKGAAVTGSVMVYKKEFKVKTKNQASNFSKISGNAFYDVSLNETWNKKKDNSGNEYFVRANDDNIQEVISELSITASSVMRNYCKKPVNNQLTGYVTLFALNKNVPSTIICKVVEDKGDTLKVEAGDVTKEVPKTAVIRAFQEAKSKQDVIDHLLQVYPDKNVNPEFFRKFQQMAR